MSKYRKKEQNSTLANFTERKLNKLEILVNAVYLAPNKRRFKIGTINDIEGKHKVRLLVQRMVSSIRDEDSE